MKPAPFDYCRPDSVDEALGVLAERGEDARVLAGGQSLGAMLNMRLLRPEVLVDIGQLSDLSEIRYDENMLEVGAAVTQASLLAWPGLKATFPLLAQALPWVGHYQTRARGTVCGSITHADPSSELPLCLAMLDGTVTLRTTRATRAARAEDFQLGMLTTAREPNELVTSARFKKPEKGTGQAFGEVGRRHGDFAIVAVAATATDRLVRLGVGGVADRPRIREFPVPDRPEDLLDGLNDFAWELGGDSDIHASARYRRDLVRRLGRQVVQQALSNRT